ncbi:MAG: polyamine ABC transporter substrate-binding protein [Proteobacteria bacterium]|nr:polyamine ABC transporter substrate-binding protein [Pseudomonadota bacterium]
MTRQPFGPRLRRRVLASLCLAAAGALLAACGGPAAPRERVVSVYNWADFIGKTTVADFEQATGIRVDYDTFDNDQTLEAKMLAGGSGYDVVSTATNYFSRQIKAGAYRRLDRSRLSGWSNLDPKVLALMASADPGNQYAMPYLHAVNGFAYNVDMVRKRLSDAPVDSLALIFDPAVVSRLADCGVSFLDSPEDVLQLALAYLHLDPNSARPEDYAAAEAVVMKVRPYIKAFDSSEYLNALANQELCVAMSWSSDYAVSMARMRAAGVEAKLAFTVPREGANATYSALLIPVDAPHVAEAHEFLNFLLRPAVIAKITNETHYGNDNLAADALVDPAIRGDPTLYPTPEMLRRLWVTSEVSPATERLRTRIWTRIKTAH